jgi:hypothetical protein
MMRKLLGLKRGTYIALAMVLSVAGIVPVLDEHASAYVQLTTRSIQLSSSATGNTGTSLLVSFQATTAARNVRIDFCSNSPLYSDSCTAPTGLNASSAAIGAGGTGVTNAWTPTAATSSFTVAHATGYSASTAVSYTITGVTNPTTVGTFYARIYTYSNQANDYSSATAPGTVADFGGIAMSTANLISITAKVQETLTFCVSGAALQPTDLTCAAATAPTLTIGHGTPEIIDQTAVDVASAYTQVSTNASGGVSMRMKSGNACSNGGLSNDGGTTCNIPGKGTIGAIVAGTAAFGLYVAPSANNTGGTGTITPDSDYHDAAHTTISSDLFYGMNGTNVTSTYGDVIATSSAPLSLTNNQLVFAATASLTTQAGIYTVNESIITTGTF